MNKDHLCLAASTDEALIDHIADFTENGSPEAMQKAALAWELLTPKTRRAIAPIMGIVLRAPSQYEQSIT